MKPRIYLLFVCCIIFQVSSIAQQNRFLYIQTENKQPFYVSIDNVILSSSASGYLIIPKLQEGTYQLNIGFPKNEWPRQVITYKAGKKDEGVLLKNFGDQGWGFYNLQSAETTMAASTKLTPAVAEAEDNDSFTQVLSEVVNTPDLKIKEKIPDPIPVFVPEVKQTNPVVAPASVVARLSENINEQGREYTYLSDGDTVNIFIPIAATAAPSASPVSTQVDSVITKATPVAEEKPVIIQSQPVVDAPINTNVENNDKLLPTVETKVAQKSSGVNMINSDCRANASDEDFMKLRKKMASEENEVKMVVVAKKAFKAKCYSTSQIKNLSVLFLNDSGRFQFFESAYPFVLDSNNFTGLQSQLTDPYYITRFEALTRR